MQSKILKAQFNRMCVSGLILDMNSVSLYAGENKTTSIEVTPTGIAIQPGPGNPVYIGTYDIKGPGYKQSRPFADFLPGVANFTARKEVDLPFVNQFKDIAIVMGTYAKIAGVIL